MLKKEEIKDGNIVYNNNNDTYHIIANVDNAISKGDRSFYSPNDTELSYSIIDLITKKEHDGICEHSHMTSHTLRIATNDEVEIYLGKLQADLIIKLGKVTKKIYKLQGVIIDYEKMKK